MTTWRRGGQRYTFDLSDGRATVRVIVFGKPPCESGAGTVEGIFEQVKRRGIRDSAEEIRHWVVTCGWPTGTTQRVR